MFFHLTTVLHRKKLLVLTIDAQQGLPTWAGFHQIWFHVVIIQLPMLLYGSCHGLICSYIDLRHVIV